MRQKGRGTKLADGRWRTSIQLPDGTRQYLHARSSAALQDKLRDARQAVDEGTLSGDKRTVADFLGDWLESSKTRIRPSTHARYAQLVNLHALPTIGKTKLRDLKAAHLQRLYTQLASSGLAPATIRQLHAVLHNALKQAHRWRLIRENPADLVDAPRVPRYEASTLTAEQARQLLAGVRSEPLEAVYVLALTAGMRQGELLGLQWRDVDLDAGTLTVRTALDRYGNLSEPKTASSRHAVQLAGIAVDALRRRKSAVEAARLVAGQAWQKSDLVFTDALGAPVASQHLLRSVHYPLLDRLGLPRVRFHDLRHSVATLLLGEGVNPKIVSELLGHSSIQITLHTYSHVTPNMHKEAVETIDRLLK